MGIFCFLRISVRMFYWVASVMIYVSFCFVFTEGFAWICGFIFIAIVFGFMVVLRALMVRN